MLFSRKSRERGTQAEQLACNFLKRAGLSCLETNFHCRRGEIDLIMQDADSLVFVEVRFRNTDSFGSAAETIRSDKQHKLVMTALYYLQTHPQRASMPARFDVISITGSSDPQIEWIKDAIQVQD